MSTDAPLPRKIAFGWATGEVGIAAYIGITMSYMLYYLTEAQGIAPALAGFALLVPRLWDAVIDPFVGAISDRTRSRMGRRRPYLLIGGISFGLLFSLIFQLPVTLSPMIKVGILVALYMVTSTAFTFYDVAFSSMAAEMTADYRARTLLVGYKMIAARAGIVLAVIAAPLFFASGPTLAAGFANMGLAAGVLMIGTGLWSFFSTRAAPQITRPIEHFSLKLEYEALKQNRPFLILWLVFLCQNIAVGATATLQIYLVIFVMKVDPRLVGAMVAISAISAMLATPLWIRLARRYGKRPIYFVSMSMAVLFTLPVLFLPAGWPVALFTLFLLAGIGDAATQLCPNAMVPDTVEYDEARTGERREGAIFGTWLLARKFGMATGAFVISLFLSFFGFQSGADATGQSDTALLGIRLAYTLVPGSMWLLGMFVLRYYRLDEDQFNALRRQMADDRAERKAEPD